MNFLLSANPHPSHPHLHPNRADDVIKDIIRDLGFDRICGTHPYKRRTPADLALLQTTAAAAKGEAANPALAPTWRAFPQEDDEPPQILQTILNPTCFRGK